jgi:hypothetical protein
MLFDTFDDGLGAESVGHQRQNGSPFGFLRLRQRCQVVPLIRYHLSQPDADGSDRWHEGARCFAGPAVGRPEYLPDPLISLGFR